MAFCEVCGEERALIGWDVTYSLTSKVSETVWLCMDCQQVMIDHAEQAMNSPKLIQYLYGRGLIYAKFMHRKELSDKEHLRREIEAKFEKGE